jgi:hypothetical protein
MPRRRRGATAVAIEPEMERGFVMRVLLHSPKDLIAGALAFAAVSAIIANALLLQAGQHPAPMFGPVVAVTAPASPLPRPRPVEATLKPADASPSDLKPADVRAADPMANLVKATAGATAITGSRRVAAVQRTLTEYGYGQLKPTGTIGADTQAAIQKFERDRKVPVTGQMSDRLVHELNAMVGKPID